MADAIASLVDILQSNWNKPPQPSIEDIADLDKGDAKRVRMLDKDVIRIFETAHNEAQPELLYDFVNQHVNLTIDIRSVKTRERLSELRDETRRILHAFRKGTASTSTESYSRRGLTYLTDRRNFSDTRSSVRSSRSHSMREVMEGLSSTLRLEQSLSVRLRLSILIYPL